MCGGFNRSGINVNAFELAFAKIEIRSSRRVAHTRSGLKFRLPRDTETGSRLSDVADLKESNDRNTNRER